jgi:hypothetical protein
MTETEAHAVREAHITIDRKEFRSPNPTTGHALYVLGDVAKGYVLYREARGHGDDELIPDTGAIIKLHDGERFYTAQSSLNPGC